MSRCPLVWVGALATVALALGVDKGYVACAATTALCLLITVTLMQLTSPWLWWSSALVTLIVAVAGLFYALHCKPLADARRRQQQADAGKKK